MKLKMLGSLLLFVCMMFSTAMGQVVNSYIPKPYIGVGGVLMPAGYASGAYQLQAGFLLNSKYLVGDTYVAYDNGKKINDATEYNNKGHDRYINSFLAFKHSNSYFGVGPRWSQLSTTNYTKGLNVIEAAKNGDFRVQAVVGHDVVGNFFSFRGQVNYVFPPFHESVSYPSTSTSPASICSGCGNGLQGPELSLFFPSPASKGHFIYRMTLALYEFHTTVTDPTNAQLTRAQDTDRHLTASTTFLLMYRF